MSELIKSVDLGGSPKGVGTNIFRSLSRAWHVHVGSALRDFLDCECERVLFVGNNVASVIDEITKALVAYGFNCREVEDPDSVPADVDNPYLSSAINILIIPIISRQKRAKGVADRARSMSKWCDWLEEWYPSWKPRGYMKIIMYDVNKAKRANDSNVYPEVLVKDARLKTIPNYGVEEHLVPRDLVMPVPVLDVGEHNDLSGTQQQLLKDLYTGSRYRQVRLSQELTQPGRDTRSFVVRCKGQNVAGSPLEFLKIGRYDPIQREYKNYVEYVATLLEGHAPILSRSLEAGEPDEDTAAFAAEFLSSMNQDFSYRTLFDCIANTSGLPVLTHSEFCECTKGLFGDVLSRLYRDEFDFKFGSMSSLPYCQRAAELRSRIERAIEEALRSFGPGAEVWNPLPYFDQLSISEAYVLEGLAFGDLHLGNIMLRADPKTRTPSVLSKDLFLIDFENLGRGPLMFDLAEIESDVSARVLAPALRVADGTLGQAEKVADAFRLSAGWMIEADSSEGAIAPVLPIKEFGMVLAIRRQALELLIDCSKLQNPRHERLNWDNYSDYFTALYFESLITIACGGGGTHWSTLVSCISATVAAQVLVRS